MAVSRADLEALVRAWPETDVAAAGEALRSLIARDREAARERRRQKLRDAGLLAHAATGLSSEEFRSTPPVEIKGEPLSETVIRDRR